MALSTNFNVNPYYDDLDENKKFLRILFKPGYAVQARELTQSQSLLQNQVNRFGRHIFENGSLVEGAQQFFYNGGFIKLESTYAGSAITANDFVNQVIVDNVQNPTVRAQVIKVYEATDTDPITLIVTYNQGTSFFNGNTIITYDASGTNIPTFANVGLSGTSGTAAGTTQVFSVNEGVYFYDGFFIKNSKQTIAVDKYNRYANGKIGFEITESIITSSTDTSLLDPAQNASNYQAPGADRYKIELVLASRSLISTDTTKFIEIARIENGIMLESVNRPLYSVLADEFARRTYDESGNYTVRPFQIKLETNATNSANLDVTLSPGKAYVFGYEFETLQPTTLTVPKPRTKAYSNNRFLSADYGNYVFLKNLTGTFPVNSYSTIDVHCVPYANINKANTSTIANTKIGTARVKTIEYDSSTNTANANTYIYRAYLFDVNISNRIVGTANNCTANTVQLGNTLTTTLYSTLDDAYTGGKLTITSGPGAGEAPKLITDYNGTTRTVTLSENFLTTPNNTSTFAVDFEFNDAESFVNFASTTRIVSADIDDLSKDLASTYQDAFIVDSSIETLVFDTGNQYVSNNISDLTYSYRRVYSAKTFDGSNQVTLTPDAGESLSSASSTSDKIEEYQIIVSNPGTSGYANGSVIPPSLYSISVNGGTGVGTITLTGAGSLTADIIATVSISSAPPQKSKSFVTASATVQTVGGEVINTNGVIVYANSTNAQTTINANNIVKLPGVAQLLYVSDVAELLSVYEFNGATVANTGYTNITTRYELDTGQRDSYYDHAAIKLKPGYPAPNGPIVVRYSRYSSADEGGYFSVDSYPNYDDIPAFTSPVTGQEFYLRDCLDFRPVRKNATAAIGTGVEFNVGVVDNPKLVTVGSDVILDYQYYLPRIDKVVLNKNKSFEVIQGNSNSTPVEPSDKDNAMNLYVLTNPAYVADARDIQIEYVDNKRFTMRDIGSIEKRVQNLEYYTSLNLLEQNTINKQDLTILDSTNLPRFKNGIITDSFVGSAIADVSREEFNASIDITKKELRPSFNIDAQILVFDAANSTSIIKTGNLLLPNCSSVAIVDQPLASKAVNINPFQVTNFLGKVSLRPQTDFWIDTTRRPDVLVNIGGTQDAWDTLLTTTGASNYAYSWGTWQNNWTGQPRTLSTSNFWTADGVGGSNLFQRSVTATQVGQTRTGTASRVVTENITQSIGDRIIDISVIPYMRARNIAFTGLSFKPNERIYAFFDDVNVDKYSIRANEFILGNNNLQYDFDGVELCNVVNATTNTTIMTINCGLTSNNIFYASPPNFDADEIIFSSANNVPLKVIGLQSGQVHTVITRNHYFGRSNGATTNTITLGIGAEGANNVGDFVGSIITTVGGNPIDGLRGQQRTITAYNVATRVATVSSNWDVVPTPDTLSQYGIGNLRIDAYGRIHGRFNVPPSTFRTGEKLLRLMNESTGDLISSTTSGDATFFAQGLLQTKEEVMVSTIAPVVQRMQVNESRVITDRTVTDSFIMNQPPSPPGGDGGGGDGGGDGGGGDPLAQTFFISPAQYPDGIFVEKVRACFKSKDDVYPVTCQLRPSVNGYPSSGIIYPYGNIDLTPDKVKITETPDLDDATKYTEFVFPSPVYLQPGEHSFVFLTNSLKYEMFVAEKDKTDIASQQLISQQPYLGSFFESQNGSTWNANQNIDMMFRIYRKQFNVGSSTAQFKVITPEANTLYDLVHLITSEIVVANTAVSYSFISEKESGGLTAQTPIIPLTDYEMNDGNGRRKLNIATGNNTFVVRASLSTLSPDVGPVLDTTRFGFITVENKINQLPLANNDFVITQGGSGYTGNAKVTISAPPNGTTANAYAYVANGNVVSIIVDTEGSGYTTSPTITIDAPPVAGGNTTATAIYNGEDSKSGGNSVARYITRKVTLADGFESGDLRVYLTAYKPSGSNIFVYYKILSKSDPDTFDNKNYQLMTQLGELNFNSINKADYRELTFAPGINNAANNSVSYISGSTTYTTFKTFVIKVVITGGDPTDVAKVRDFRAIALPTG
jgi:hypothetical protein